MIEINLKNVCKSCPHADLEVDSTHYDDAIYAVVYCKHSDVCKFWETDKKKVKK